MPNEVIARKQDEGKALWVLGGLYDVKVAGEETGGALTLVEMTIPPGMGPPPHTHAGAEAVYVLEGVLSYHIGEETVEGGPGSVFHIPEGTWEHFEPAGDAPVRILVIYTPGGIDEFFAEVGEPAPSRQVPPTPEGPPDLERIMAAASRYGMEMRPPEE